MLRFKDSLDLLYQLGNERTYGAKLLRNALADDCSPAFLNECVLPFLARLGAPELSRGTCKAPLGRILEVIFTVPGFVETLRDEIAVGVVAPLEPIAWSVPVSFLGGFLALFPALFLGAACAHYLSPRSLYRPSRFDSAECFRSTYSISSYHILHHS